MRSLLTVDANDFSSETNRNTFGVRWITVSYTIESFSNAYLAANFIELEIPDKNRVTFFDMKFDFTYGHFGSILWSIFWEKARPSKNNTTALILNIWNHLIGFRLKTAADFSMLV